MTSRDPKENPFKMPTDEEVFILRDEEKRLNRANRENLKGLPVHKKSTWSSNMASAKVSEPLDDEDDYSHAATMPGADVQLPNVDKRVKDNMTQYITKKRKMGLARMSLATKRQEIRKLDDEALHAEKRIAQMKDQLKHTEGKFNNFLERTELEHKNAAAKAEEETKLKQDKQQEIKKVNQAKAQIETDKRKNEEQLNQCKHFKEFLDKLVPFDWIKETLVHLRQEDARSDISARLEKELNDAVADGLTEQEELERQERKKAQLERECGVEFAHIDREIRPRKQELSAATLGELNDYDPDRVPMYFTHPTQISQKFVDIEEGNLFLITTCQEREAEIEAISAQFNAKKQEMTELAKQRHAQMETIRKHIQVEQSKLDALQERLNRMMRDGKDAADNTGKAGQDPSKSKEGGEGSPKTQDQIKTLISNKVKSIYETLFPKEDASNIGTLGALTGIEVRLDEMRQQINDMDKAYVAQVLRQRDKDRRQAARQVLLAKQKKERDERSLRMLERSTNPVEKRVGKPVMWRSRPLDHKKQETTTAAETKNDDDDLFM